MGLGLFIAKTLLERSGAELTFANAAADTKGKYALDPRLRGAIVNVHWQRDGFEEDAHALRKALGPNQQF